MNVFGTGLVGVRKTRMNKKHLKLFSTPVSVYDVPEYEEINKHILPLADNNQWGFKRKKQLWSIRQSNVGLSKLYAYFLYISAQYVNHHYNSNYQPTDFDLVHGWLNTAHVGEYQRPHDHGGVSLAVTYYVQVDLKSGNINLYDPRGNRGWMGPQKGEFSNNERESHLVYEHTPVIGQAIIFPGWLLHSTEMNRSDTTRISVTSNVALREKYI